LEYQKNYVERSNC